LLTHPVLLAVVRVEPVDGLCMLLQVFKELFDAVINEKHGGFSPSDKHPAPDLDSNKVNTH